ncbi:unnamed protein product [Protopolystoma xenopodis]|uniref:Uncharacterized protein n=1 Tax=Protopolystoma xenopodis TaxID=117903 RepID=A0A3S4ZPR2_9PLAT|nr:unnamed protein product [Protopolystoma xenopodis]
MDAGLVGSFVANVGVGGALDHSGSAHGSVPSGSAISDRPSNRFLPTLSSPQALLPQAWSATSGQSAGTLMRTGSMLHTHGQGERNSGNMAERLGK